MDRVLLPGAALLESCRASSGALLSEAIGDAPVSLLSSTIPSPLVLPSNGLRQTQRPVARVDIIISPECSVIVTSATGTHCKGSFSYVLLADVGKETGVPAVTPSGIGALIRGAATSSPSSLGYIEGTSALQDGFQCHPAALDATLHLGVFAVRIEDTQPSPYVPVGIGAFMVPSPARSSLAVSMASGGLQEADRTLTNYFAASDAGAQHFKLHHLDSRRMRGRSPSRIPADILVPYGVVHHILEPSKLVELQEFAEPVYCLRLEDMYFPTIANGAASVFKIAQGLLACLKDKQSSAPAMVLCGRSTSCSMSCSGDRPESISQQMGIVQSMFKVAEAEKHARLQGYGLHPSSVTSQTQGALPPSDAYQLPIERGSAWTMPLVVRLPERSVPYFAVDNRMTPVAIFGGTGSLGTLLGIFFSASLEGDVRVLGRTGRLGQARLPNLRGASSGGCVTVTQCDASCLEDGWAGLGLAARSIIFHASGVLNDMMIPHQTSSSLRRVLAAKVPLAEDCKSQWAYLGIQAGLFFSSSAAFLGNAGQLNYAAANAALDIISSQLVDQVGSA
jgi:hypothetical protein